MTEHRNPPGRVEVDPVRGLLIGGCSAAELARRYGTPLLVVDEDALRARCREYVTAFNERWPTTVAYAAKAFMSRSMVRLVLDEGLDLDVASSGELRHALAAGAPAARVTVHGHYKTDEEIGLAVGQEAGCVVVDSPDEVEPIRRAARRRGGRQAVMVRVNPAVAIATNDKYRTGGADSKFGLGLRSGEALSCVERLLGAEEVDLLGVHYHLGSQIREPGPHLEALARIGRWLAHVHQRTGWRPSRIVAGGGMAVRYLAGEPAAPTPREWAEALVPALRRHVAPHCAPGMRFGIEPGRSIAAEAGTTLYTVGPVRRVDLGEAGTRRYLNVDGGLSDNPRPTMYGARHEVVHVTRSLAEATTSYEVMGKHCETDLLFGDVLLPETRRGDLLAVLCTGAYTYAQASTYNRFPRPAVVFVSGGRARLSLRRETDSDLATCEADQPPPVIAEVRRAGLTFQLGDAATVPRLEPVWREFHERVSRFGTKLGDLRPRCDIWDATARMYTRELAAGTGLLTVAEDHSGTVQGFAFGHDTAPFAFWVGYDRVIELDDVVVGRASRRPGVVHGLLDLFDAHARARGYTACRGLVLNEDNAVQRFWQTRGFRPAMGLFVRPLGGAA
jgi:diaminopimelate decarboxylase